MTRQVFTYLDLFDTMIADLEKGLSTKSIYRVNFPPVDVLFEKKSRNLWFQFALAGYRPEDISVEFEDDQLILRSNGDSTEFARSPDDSTVYVKEDFEYLKKGIKGSKFESSYYVPFSKYDVNASTAKFENGMLTVVIPFKKEAVKKVSIIQK